jgi:hypothetical protein
MSLPGYIHELSHAMSAIEESTEIENELNAAQTANDVRRVLQAHRQFYLSMSQTVRAGFNDRIKQLFVRLP